MSARCGARSERRRPDCRCCPASCRAHGHHQGSCHQLPGRCLSDERRQAEHCRAAEEVRPEADELKAQADEIDTLKKQLQASGDKLSDAERQSRTQGYR